MRVGMDPRTNQLLRMLNQLEGLLGLLGSWSKARVEGPSGSGGEASVPINVGALDLSNEVHGVLVEWADRVADERGMTRHPREWSAWAMTPSGTWYATSGNTALLVAWLRRHASWVVGQDWYEEVMWPELRDLRRRAMSMLGLSRPPRHLVELAVELAASGRSVQEVGRVQRAEG